MDLATYQCSVVFFSSANHKRETAMLFSAGAHLVNTFYHSVAHHTVPETRQVLLVNILASDFAFVIALLEVSMPVPVSKLLVIRHNIYLVKNSVFA